MPPKSSIPSPPFQYFPKSIGPCWRTLKSLDCIVSLIFSMVATKLALLTFCKTKGRTLWLGSWYIYLDQGQGTWRLNASTRAKIKGGTRIRLCRFCYTFLSDSRLEIEETQLALRLRSLCKIRFQHWMCHIVLALRHSRPCMLECHLTYGGDCCCTVTQAKQR